jgi:hypothetical protein
MWFEGIIWAMKWVRNVAEGEGDDFWVFWFVIYWEFV